MSDSNESTLKEALCQLNDSLQAECCFVMSSSGMVVAEAGKLPSTEVSTMGVLVWGIYTAAERLHELLKDTESPVVTHHTTHKSLFIFGLANQRGIICVLHQSKSLGAEKISTVDKACRSISKLMPEDDANWMEKYESSGGEVPPSISRFDLEKPPGPVFTEEDFEQDLFHSDNYDDPCCDRP